MLPWFVSSNLVKTILLSIIKISKFFTNFLNLVFNRLRFKKYLYLEFQFNKIKTNILVFNFN